MELEIEQKDLLHLVTLGQSIAEKKQSMPVLINFLFSVESGYLKVYTTDLQISLSAQVKVQEKTPGRFCVHSRNFLDIIKELSPGIVHLATRENNCLEIRQNRYFSKMMSTDPMTYPAFPDQSVANFTRIKSAVLKEMIHKTLYSMSTDEKRHHLNGLYFEKRTVAEKPILRMVATDGHRLSYIDRSVEDDLTSLLNSVSPTDSQQINSALSGVIIPRKGVAELSKLLESSKDYVDISVDSSLFVLKIESSILSIRLIQGRYPNYQQFIPQKLVNHCQIDRDVFLGSLRRVALLAHAKSKSVAIHVTAGKLEMTTKNVDLGDAKEELDVDYSGDDVKISFNSRYVIDVLDAIDDKFIDFNFNDSRTPSIIKPHTDSQYTCVLMPMKF